MIYFLFTVPHSIIAQRIIAFICERTAVLLSILNIYTEKNKSCQSKQPTAKESRKSEAPVDAFPALCKPRE